MPLTSPGALGTAPARQRASGPSPPRLKERCRREQRHVKNINHVIARTIATEDERTFGLSLEELMGIRVRLRKSQRVAFHSRAFAQLGDFIVYKARRTCVPIVFVDPAYSSRECAERGHIDRLNRVAQARFACRSCGVIAHADRRLPVSSRAEARPRGLRGVNHASLPPHKRCLDGGSHPTASWGATSKPGPPGPSQVDSCCSILVLRGSENAGNSRRAQAMVSGGT
ncbi:transposase [Streptomyces sp. NPDC007861]|uniref:transposase n=1 Tax=Streptomyces sp. NPDC007861 TaxID=3154893 RepID=UPI0033F81D78